MRPSGDEHRRRLISPAAWRLVVAQATLVLVGVLAVTVVPPGWARLALLLPVLCWVPGRGMVAALGLARSAELFVPAVAVTFSIVLLIAVALGSYVWAHHLPLSSPVVIAAATLPLNLFERTTVVESSQKVWRDARYGAIAVLGIVAAGAALWLVQHRLPGTSDASYLRFSFGPPYAQLTGTIKAEPGELVKLPVVAAASEPSALSGLSVMPFIDGSALPAAATPLRAGGTAEVDVRVPAGCLHQVRLVLERNSQPLRSIDLYADAPGPTPCGAD